ncbi:beta-ketoacyl synthase N-terminal-like domain-containing protein [Aquimarina rhabdastrellae]
MRRAYLNSDVIISPLGFTSEENIAKLRNNISGITEQDDTNLHRTSFYGAKIADDKLEELSLQYDLLAYTRLEQMMLLAVKKLLEKNPSLDIHKTGVIIATTKGNVDQLAIDMQSENAYLTSLSNTIESYFTLKNTPIILSNACISGGLAVAVAKRMIQAEQYDDVIVIGGDVLTAFTLSGFFSFQAVSDQPCKPFSKNRTGVSLGEAAAALWVSSNKIEETNVVLTGDASVNDANHISGPSRTGEGLFLSITKALKEANIESEAIDYISAHGTATPFNDEMESIAFSRANLLKVPLNSFKGYYGHTLGASALIETIIARHCLLNNEVFASKGFDELGVSEPVTVLKENKIMPLQRVLNTASGFGGCNVALILEKINS